MHRYFFALTALIGACHPAPQVATRAPKTLSADAIDEAAQQITPDYLRTQVANLTSDASGGRAPATPGDQRTRASLIALLQGLGLSPGAAGWEQPFSLVSLQSALPKQWSFRHGESTLPLAWWDDYIAGSGVQRPHVELAPSDVVFVGYGIDAPEYGWDDFKGQDVRGKVLLMLNNDPDWDPALFAGTTRLYYGRWTYKFESAARHGASGALIIHTTESAGYPFQVVRSSWGGPRFELPATSDAQLAVKGWLSEEAARKLVALSGRKLDELVASARSKSFTPVSLVTETSLQFDNQIESAPSANVFGVVRGSDPRLADEYVVVSAHHDHLGIGKPDARGDTIYNGALDNGAGMAQVLAIARALEALPRAPRRSVIILFVGAEEQGLLGSQFFVQHLPVAAGKVAANLNFDGGNIWGRTRDITQLGRGKSTLDEVASSIAAQQRRVVESDQFPDRGSFYRSDQFNFAKIGVPALYMKTGTQFLGKPESWGREQILRFEAENYHQPSDELRPEWNFDGMVEDAQFGFRALLQIAEADQMPRWNAGDEFEAARRVAIDGSAKQ